MKRMTRIIASSAFLGAFLSLGGCDHFDSELRVAPPPRGEAGLRFIWDQGGERGVLEFTPGIYPVTIALAERAGADSFLTIQTEKEVRRVAFRLPAPGRILRAIEPIVVEPEELRQPVRLVLSREIDQDGDRVEVRLVDPASGRRLAVARGHLHENFSGVSESGGFLRSYQRVKYAQRGVYIPIDGKLNNAVANGLANVSAQILLAPWVYARYRQVEWRVGLRGSPAGSGKEGGNEKGNESAARARLKWASLLEKNPVVDYFAFLHGGNDTAEAAPLLTLPKKRNQLRFVYTEGCDSRSASSFIRDFNASYAAGHSAISASPFFSFSIVRNWTLGMSALSSIREGFREGKALARILYPLIKAAGFGQWPDFARMIADSEPMFSWTRELPLEKTGMSSSAAPARDTDDLRLIYESRISGYENAVLSGQPTRLLAPQDELALELPGARY